MAEQVTISRKFKERVVQPILKVNLCERISKGIHDCTESLFSFLATLGPAVVIAVVALSLSARRCHSQVFVLYFRDILADMSFWEG